MKKLFIFISVLLFSFVFVSPVRAFEMIGADVANLPSDRTIEGTLFIGGNSVTVDGDVHGDIFCGGQTVVISGAVDGDVICGAQNIRITGPVGGNIRVVGQTVEVTGLVTKNVTVGGQSLVVSESAVIQGESLFGAQSVRIMGRVDKSIAGAGKNIVIGGNIGGDMNLQVESLEVLPSATVAGTVRYTSEREATIPETARVGAVYRSAPKLEEAPRERREKKVQPAWPMNAVGGIVIHILIGLLSVALFPNFVKRVQARMLQNPFVVGLKGAGILLFAPVFILALFLTIIGIPLALLGIGLYALPVSLSRIFVATLVGERVLEQLSGKNKLNLFYQILVGVPVLWLLLKAPWVGGLISFVAIIWGLGGMLETLLQKRSK